MTFANPEAFLLLLPLAILLAWRFWRRKKLQPAMNFSSYRLVAVGNRGWKTRLAELPQILYGLALALVVVALARPQTSDTRTQHSVEGIDIMIALDISDSMLIEDMRPLNRLEAAKDTLKKFIKARNSDRIGVVIFAGESFTLVPLTLDYDLILSRVAEIRTAQEAHIKDGTAIGVALANAAGKLKDSTAKSRVMIFMTDGENNSGLIDPETGLSVAKGYGIKVYSIGIGHSGPTRIPIYQKDSFGNVHKTYQPFESTVNDELLAKMASDTGGKYYRADKEDSLQPIFKDIDSLERTKIEVNSFTRFEEHFTRFLGFALCSLLLAQILSLSILRRAL